ncbi:hypothetical protein C5748_18125 [Phyllobacterium phragmitis]|uniref:Uncharacterized protein n=1 Tax=Phyllobacterium phragmitis TaxID=2670329 RepID=A0A2S9INI4_9HYPH|nr:hypothetical protein [Phyllobacterium phragmitis]PRD42075.1 hypothetical protein C5748_18125 [Phyllobacterium phragmitis]
MIALTRTDITSHIKSMPPRSRGRTVLERLNRDLTTNEILGDVLAAHLDVVLTDEFPAEVV